MPQSKRLKQSIDYQSKHLEHAISNHFPPKTRQKVKVS